MRSSEGFCTSRPPSPVFVLFPSLSFIPLCYGLCHGLCHLRVMPCFSRVLFVERPKDSSLPIAVQSVRTAAKNVHFLRPLFIHWPYLFCRTLTILLQKAPPFLRNLSLILASSPPAELLPGYSTGIHDSPIDEYGFISPHQIVEEISYVSVLGRDSWLFQNLRIIINISLWD